MHRCTDLVEQGIGASKSRVRRDHPQGLDDVCAIAARVLAWVDLLQGSHLVNSMESLYESKMTS